MRLTARTQPSATSSASAGPPPGPASLAVEGHQQRHHLSASGAQSGGGGASGGARREHIVDYRHALAAQRGADQAPAFAVLFFLFAVVTPRQVATVLGGQGLRGRRRQRDALVGRAEQCIHRVAGTLQGEQRGGEGAAEQRQVAALAQPPHIEETSAAAARLQREVATPPRPARDCAAQELIPQAPLQTLAVRHAPPPAVPCAASARPRRPPPNTRITANIPLGCSPAVPPTPPIPATRNALYTISGPSGVGKSSLVAALARDQDHIAVSVSYTTRPQRDGETEGLDYHFIDPPRFAAMVASGEFLEHAEVFGHHYGTSRQWVEETLASGREALLEIDWQGAQQVREAMPQGVGIFVLPPRLGALGARLSGRGTDTPALRRRRLASAVADMRHARDADYLIVNERFEQALSDLRRALRGGALLRRCQEARHAELLRHLWKADAQ